MPSFRDLLRTDSGYYVWPKYADIKFNDYFSSVEFRCPCENTDCNEQRISVELIEKLTRIREKIRYPIRIASGFRCKKHQAALLQAGEPTVTNSQHELGNAADPYCYGHQDALLKLCEAEFKAIGHGPTRLHVDTRADKIRRWTYK